jgi:hypothetical protein
MTQSRESSWMAKRTILTFLFGRMSYALRPDTPCHCHIIDRVIYWGFEK